MNPALLRMLNIGPEAVGRRYSDGPISEDWLRLCAKVLRTGEEARFEFHVRAVDRWCEIAISRLEGDYIAQFFLEISDRKLAAARQGDLLDELNHRVKNNLMMVAGVLRAQARGASPDVAEQLLKAVARVHSISELHANLYKGNRAESVEFGAYLKELCAILAKTVLEGDGVTIASRTEPVLLPVAQAATLGMIVNELATNAAKHAFPDGRGEIRVALARAGERLLLSVRDNGQGLPPDVEMRGGIGMRLVRSLAQQAGAELTVENSGGAAYTLTLPFAPAAAESAASAR